MEQYFEQVVRNVSHKWDDLARKLGFSENEIKGIMTDEPYQDRRCREVLNRWRNREGSKATLQVLKQALIDIGANDIAERLTAESLEVDVQEYFDKVINGVSYKWEDLARKLGFNRNEIKGIGTTEPSPDHRCRELLFRWRNREGRRATVLVLKQALIDIGERLTAEKLGGTHSATDDPESDDSDTEESDVEDQDRPIDPPIRSASEPIEVELGGTEMKALYHQACEQGTHLVFNTLLMLVGKHGNGKSSLQDSLLQLEFKEHQPSTDGIVIKPCLMTGKEKWTITKGDRNTDFLHAVRTEMVKKRKEMEEMDQVLNVPEEETEQAGLGPHALLTDPSGHMEDAVSSQRPIEDSQAFKLATSKDISLDLSHIVGSKERPAISIWDFAGHGVYYSNHHVFYTHYAIYILTLNLKNPLSADLKPRTKEEEDQSGICAEALQLKTEGDLVDYHLESIRAHTRPKKRDLKYDDQAEDREPTVIVVGTHKDQVETKAIKTFRADIKAHLKGKAINEHVYDRYFAIDNTKRDPEDRELEDLRDAILKVAQEQNHMGRTIPISWLELKAELMEMTKQGRPCCSLQGVIDTTDSSRIPEGYTPEENAVIILRFFHLCGDILYFDTPELRNFVVLDPQWFVDVQKTIITIPEYRRDGKYTQWERLEKEGVLENTLVDAVWGNKEKQKALKCDLIAHKDELLKMMEQFDLVLQCSSESEDEMSTTTSSPGDTTYFVPSLLTAATEEAKLFPKGTERSKPIFVAFNAKFFPIGLYHRLVIACMRRYKKKPPLAYANCARFVTNNKRQTFVITKERHYFKVELLSSVKEESDCFSHGPAVREGLDEDLRRIIDDWIPGIGYKWCFCCCCEEHRKKKNQEEDRFNPIKAEEVEEWFEEGEAVCDEFGPATTAIEDIGLTHWYLNPNSEPSNIVLPQSSSGSRIPIVLLINDEYGTSKGGISTINCGASQTLQGKAVVYATVLQLNVPKQDQESAERDKVKLVTPDQPEGDTRDPSIDSLTFDYKSRYPKSTLTLQEYQRSPHPKSTLPPHVDVIVGHADITDTAARNIHNAFYKDEADLIMFTHVLPEDTEYFKGGQRAIKASEKEEAMLSQVDKAKAAFSVGERIYKHFIPKYGGDKKPREHHLFLPRPSKLFEEVTIQPKSGEGELVVLSIGRVKNVENLKGYNLAARAIGIVRRYLEYLRWITRGISKDDWKESLKILEANLNSGDLMPTMRPYGTQKDIKTDMMMAHLVLMPSRSEPFGLVGLEAIAAGIPVLISDKSGLADMIKKLVAEKKLPKGLLNRIVETSVQDSDMDDNAKTWANEIRKTLTDTETAFTQAKKFKDTLLESKYWEDSEREFLRACGITDDMPSGGSLPASAE